VIEVSWDQMTRVKEEFFPNGKRISITVYRKPTAQQEKTKAWAVYRDDVTDIDGLARVLQQVIPETCEWKSETVHE
jgi:glycine cleavage system regulatory protein